MDVLITTSLAESSFARRGDRSNRFANLMRKRPPRSYRSESIKSRVIAFYDFLFCLSRYSSPIIVDTQADVPFGTKIGLNYLCSMQIDTYHSTHSERGSASTLNPPSIVTICGERGFSSSCAIIIAFVEIYQKSEGNFHPLFSSDHFRAR